MVVETMAADGSPLKLIGQCVEPNDRTICVRRLRTLDRVEGHDNDDAVLGVSQRWWDEILRDGNVDVIDELFTDPFIRHTGSGTERESRAAYKGRLGEFRRVLSRADTVIDDRVVDGDKVWTRATSRGINRETGERSIVTWLLIQRVENGRIAEHWVATFPGVDWTS